MATRYLNNVLLKIRRQHGFTLLEVMIALAIIAVALVSLLALGNRSLTLNERLQKTTQATLLAQQKMTETEFMASQNGVVGITDAEGVFTVPYTEYRWQRKISPTLLPSVQMVTIAVLWGAPGDNESVDVTSFLF